MGVPARLHPLGRLRLREPHGPYEYLSYGFHNHSTDILDLFERVCRAVDLDCRRTAHDVRIYRRTSVARLLEHVGVKR